MIDSLASWKIYFMRLQDGEWVKIKPISYVNFNVILFVVVIGHHTQQGAVRHVDSRIDHHHQQIEGIGPDALAHRTEFGCVEQECEDEAKGNGSEDDPRTIGAPATLCAVGQRTH